MPISLRLDRCLDNAAFLWLQAFHHMHLPLAAYPHPLSCAASLALHTSEPLLLCSATPLQAACSHMHGRLHGCTFPYSAATADASSRPHLSNALRQPLLALEGQAASSRTGSHCSSISMRPSGMSFSAQVSCRLRCCTTSRSRMSTQPCFGSFPCSSRFCALRATKPHGDSAACACATYPLAGRHEPHAS